MMDTAVEVSFDVDIIDLLYINAAIYEMNEKTQSGFFKLSKHISELYAFIDAVKSLLSTYQPNELIGVMAAPPKMDHWPEVPQWMSVARTNDGKQQKVLTPTNSYLKCGSRLKKLHQFHYRHEANVMQEPNSLAN